MDAIIEILKAVLFGVVEGVTEWLPVSSTGHMMLLDEFVQLNVSEAFYSTFLVVIQLGAIMAVIILYFNKLNPFSRRKTLQQKRTTWNIWGKVVVGSIPALIVGLLFDDWFEENVMTSDIGYIVVSVALIVYGVAFIVIERINRKRIRRALVAERTYGRARPSDEYESVDGASAEYDASSIISKVNNFDQLSYPHALLIGVFESLAVVPGTSRSGAIIVGGMLTGVSRTVATEFAFFLAIPIMFGWSLLKFIKHGLAFSGFEWLILAVGCVVAFAVSMLSIKFLMSYIKKNDFTAFGWYRIILAAFVLAFFGCRAAGLF